MFHDLRKATPWLAIFAMSLMVGIGAARAARHCLLGRQFNIRVGAIHRVGPPFWGLSCGRAVALALSDYAYVIAEGRIFTEGLPAELAAKPEIRRAYLGL
jgi:hypothetical protein